MRAVLQRVTRASVSVDGEIVGAIDRPGLVALVGVAKDDGEPQVVHMARRISELKILRDEQNCLEAGAPVLLVSQFTLLADVRKGRRPSWSRAAGRELASPLIDDLADRLRNLGLEVVCGRFGADMQVQLINDGPVTIVIDSSGQ